jgi:hypothetical protein
MIRRVLLCGVIALTVAVAPHLGSSFAQSRAPGRAPGVIVLTWGVGGVLTQDGTLWQFRPESHRWVTIDQSFGLDGEHRNVLPLPVPAREIATMQGFGFLVTRGGEAWIYNLDKNRWENIGTPSR